MPKIWALSCLVFEWPYRPKNGLKVFWTISVWYSDHGSNSKPKMCKNIRNPDRMSSLCLVFKRWLVYWTFNNKMALDHLAQIPVVFVLLIFQFCATGFSSTRVSTVKWWSSWSTTFDRLFTVTREQDFRHGQLKNLLSIFWRKLSNSTVIWITKQLIQVDRSR